MEDLEGCAMSIAVEGLQRAMTVEVQALVVLSPGGFGKKTVDGGGLSYQRLQLLLGVLQKHCAVFIGKSRDVYVNVVGASSSGGATTGSTSRKQQAAAALDLAVAVALASSLVSIPVRGDTVFLAQVGLLGELRSLSNMEARLLHAERMGFSRVVVAGKRLRPGRRQNGMEYLECPTLRQALELGLTAAIPKRRRKTSSSTPSGTAKGSSSLKASPESLDELELNDIILDDDEDDEGEYY
jgi:DNA repair protein RadA/Sms